MLIVTEIIEYVLEEADLVFKDDFLIGINEFS